MMDSWKNVCCPNWRNESTKTRHEQDHKLDSKSSTYADDKDEFGRRDRFTDAGNENEERQIFLWTRGTLMSTEAGGATTLTYLVQKRRIAETVGSPVSHHFRA